MTAPPRSSKTKIAFTGTNSSGKTTMAMAVASRLKSDHHVLAELVSSQDRKITWKDEHFPVDIRAHFGMITNLITAEVQAELKGDADVVVTDRSVLDLYSIALVDHPNDDRIRALGETVKAWASTYTKIFYLPPLAYQEDGKRPPNEFRMRTHKSLIENVLPNFTNIVHVDDRTQVFSKIRQLLGIQNVNPILALDAKLSALAFLVKLGDGCKLWVKPRATAFSDFDVWFTFNDAPHTPATRRALEETADDLESAAHLLFGNQVKFHFMAYPLSAVQELRDTHPGVKPL